MRVCLTLYTFVPDSLGSRVKVRGWGFVNVKRIVKSLLWVAGPSKMLKRAPVWLKRPAAATFGFGGRLASVLNEKRTLADGERVDAAHIEIKQVHESRTF